MIKFIKRSHGRFLSILVSTALILGIIQVSMPLKAFAMPQSNAAAQIDNTINGNILNSLANADNSTKTETQTVTESTEDASNSADSDKTEDIEAADMTGDKEYSKPDVYLNGTDSTFSITTSAGSNGTVSPSEASIPYGSNRSVVAAADSGYQIAAFTVDGVLVSEAEGLETYTRFFDDIDDNHTVDVTFEIKTWEVTFTFNTDGIIKDGNLNPVDSGGKITANEGDSPGFTAESNAGYHINGIVIDSITRTDGTFDNTQTAYSHTFTNISENHTVTVIFSINTYNIDIAFTGNGSVTVGDVPADSTHSISHGESLTLSLTPAEGNDVKEILLDGIQSDTYDLSSDDISYTYVIASISTDHTVSAVFAPIETIQGDETNFYEVAGVGLLSGYPMVSGEKNVYNYLNNGASVTLIPKNPYSRIRINEYESITSVPLTNSVLIRKIEVYKSDQPEKGWKIVPMLRPLQIIIDQTAPMVTDIPSMDWTNKNYTIEGEVTDEDTQTAPSSGLSRVVWSKTPLTKEQVLEEKTNTAFISDGKYSFIITTEQNNELFYIYAIDKADNVSDKTTTAVKIDKTMPEISEFTFQKTEPSIVSGVINFLTFGTFFNDDIEVIIKGQDTGTSSGLKEITLYSDGNEVETKTVGKDSAVFKLTLAVFNDNEITASAKDTAGNESLEKTKPTKVKTNALSDKVSLKSEKPVISINAKNNPLYTSSEKNWYDGDVEFDVNVSTESGGIYSVVIKVNNQIITTDKNGKAIDANFFESQTLQEKFTVNTDTNSLEGENIIEVIAVNNYGNEVTSGIRSYIDTTNPEVVGFDINKEKEGVFSKMFNFLLFGNFFNEKIKIKVHADDQQEIGSGIGTIILYADGKMIDDSPKPATAADDGTYEAEFILPPYVIPEEKLLDVVLTAVATDNVAHITGQDDDNPDGIPAAPTSVNPDLKSNRMVIETIVPVVDILSPEAFFTDSNNRKWYFEDIPLTVTAKDLDSGIRSVQIKINGTDILTDVDGKPVNTSFYDAETKEEVFVINTSQGVRAADGSYFVEIIVTDNAGNKVSASDIVYKDIDDPFIEEYQFEPSSSDGFSETSEFVEYLEYAFYFNKEAIVIIQVTDPGPSSGLDRLVYRLVSYENGKKTEETKETINIVDGRAELTIPQGFKGQIFTEASDNTAHISSEETPKAFVIDNASPVIKINYNSETSYKDAEGNKLYVPEMNFTVEVSDYESGIREIGYSQSAEKESWEKKIILLDNVGYNVGAQLEDGWSVAEMDVNLVTKVTKTFFFDSDDNEILLTFDAADRSENREQNVQTEKITIDKTPPVINVVFRNDESKNNYYYSSNRIADITVTERNFDPSLIKTTIENQFGKVPDIAFTSISDTEHAAVIEFDEGDYIFNLTGMDRGNQEAAVNFSGGNEKLFYVDKIKPVIEENFNSFSKAETKNSFNTDKTVEIKVIEHNFSPDLINLNIKRKDAGAAHTGDDLYDITWELLSGIEWESSGDIHTISFPISEDGIFQIDMVSTDLAENSSDTKSTVVFEIDKTAPIVRAKNGITVKEDDLEFLDIYPYARKDDPAPTVEFEDLNIDYIKYALSVYIPENSSTEKGIVIKPVPDYVEEDQAKSGVIKGSKFKMPPFTKDGVYELELTAVDVAGNESLVNVNTYARMIEQDVLAYILESNVADKSGIYSFQYENGDAISKRPDNFSDIKIQVFAKKGTDIDIVLRDNNGDEISTNTQAEADESIYGVGIYNCNLKADFFKEKFQGDTDVELRLAVNNQGKRIDLGKLHIDNIAPTCTLPEEFKSWSWYYGEELRTITINNISELIDESQCRVYDNGMEIEFAYSDKENTLVFTLEKGWHNVGIILDDVAGNAYNIQEKENIHIGFFWLWVITAVSVILLIIVYCMIRYHIRKKSRLENEY